MSDSNDHPRDSQQFHDTTATATATATSRSTPKQSLSSSAWPILPPWASSEENRKSWGEPLFVDEWKEDENDNDNDSTGKKSSTTSYRALNGWKGNDLVHSKTSPVRVLEYRVKYLNQDTTNNNQLDGGDYTTKNVPSIEQQEQQNGNSFQNNNMNNSTTITSNNGHTVHLTGIVHFTSQAESHKGYCHGGSMCSIMDDIIGWTGFCASGKCKPWSGYTVQVNTRLMKPVPVGQILMLECWIVRMERRKVYVKAKLTDPVDSNKHQQEVVGNTTSYEQKTSVVVHAEADGLVILNRGALLGL